MNIKSKSIAEIEKELAEVEKAKKSFISLTTKLDSLIESLSCFRDKIKAIVNNNVETNKKILPAHNVKIPRAEYGAKQNLLKELFSAHNLTTKTSFLKLVEMGKAAPLDTIEGNKQYKSHRSIISNMLKNGEIVSSDGKARNGIWKLTAPKVAL